MNYLDLLRKHRFILFMGLSESLYVAGSENIGMKLCDFISGLIEGFLISATQEAWNIDEVQCISSGYEKCKFLCRKG